MPDLLSGIKMWKDDITPEITTRKLGHYFKDLDGEVLASIYKIAVIDLNEL